MSTLSNCGSWPADWLFTISIAVLVGTKAVLADPPNHKDDGANDQAILDELNNDDPDYNAAHVTHITIGALACLLSKTFFAAAETAFIVCRTFVVNGFALEASLLSLMAFKFIFTTIGTTAVGSIINLVARLAFGHAASAGTGSLIADTNTALRVGQALLVLKEAVTALFSLVVTCPGAALPPRASRAVASCRNALVRELTQSHTAQYRDDDQDFHLSN